VAHRVHAHIRFALNGFVPINRRLPPEVLGIIPSFLVQDRDRITATHVCRRWRNTFLSTPSLWTRISAFENPEKTEAYLERSGDTLLDITISVDTLWTQGGTASFQMLCPLSNRCRTARFLKDRPRMNIFPMIRNPCPHLLELYLEISYGTTFLGIKDLNRFPSLKSLTLIGDIRHLRFSQPLNLRKLGIGCDGRGFRLSSLLRLLAKIPLLEEFEVTTPPDARMITDAGPPTPVALKHLQSLVFRGIRSDFPRILAPLIAYPKDTKIVLTHCLTYDVLRSPPFNPHHQMFPLGTQLPTASPPKFIRYREIEDDEASEAGFFIDLISVDGQHTSIENRYSWVDSSPQRGRPFESNQPQMECLGFLRALDLSFVERFCVECFNPDQFVIGEVMGEMINLGTLVMVNDYPYGTFMSLGARGPVVRCPLVRRLVVRHDALFHMHWDMFLPIVVDRAARGSPLEQITLTSVFNEVPEALEVVQRLKSATELTYDLGRNTFGWEWWKV